MARLFVRYGFRAIPVVDEANVFQGAVRLISVMRQFEMLQKALTLSGEMSRKAIEDVARVNQ